MGDELTPQQERVLRLRAQGMSNEEAAYLLGISLQTMKNHMTGIYQALDVGTLVSAINAMGWIRIPNEPLPEMYEACAFVAKCGRRAGHRGQHGGFRELR